MHAHPHRVVSLSRGHSASADVETKHRPRLAPTRSSASEVHLGEKKGPRPPSTRVPGTCEPGPRPFRLELLLGLNQWDPNVSRKLGLALDVSERNAKEHGPRSACTRRTSRKTGRGRKERRTRKDTVAFVGRSGGVRASVGSREARLDSHVARNERRAEGIASAMTSRWTCNRARLGGWGARLGVHSFARLRERGMKRSSVPFESERRNRRRHLQPGRRKSVLGSASRRDDIPREETGNKCRDFAPGTEAFVSKSSRSTSLGIVGKRVLLLSLKNDDGSNWIVFVPCFGLAVLSEGDLAPCFIQNDVNMPCVDHFSAGLVRRGKGHGKETGHQSKLTYGHIVATHSTTTVLGIAGMKAYLLEVPKAASSTNPHVLVRIAATDEVFCLAQNEFCQDTSVPEEALPWWTTARSTTRTRRLGIDGKWVLVLPRQGALGAGSGSEECRDDADNGFLPVWSPKTSLIFLDMGNLDVNQHTPLHLLYTEFEDPPSPRSGPPFSDWWRGFASWAGRLFPPAAMS